MIDIQQKKQYICLANPLTINNFMSLKNTINMLQHEDKIILSDINDFLLQIKK